MEQHETETTSIHRTLSVLKTMFINQRIDLEKERLKHKKFVKHMQSTFPEYFAENMDADTAYKTNTDSEKDQHYLHDSLSIHDHRCGYNKIPRYRNFFIEYEKMDPNDQSDIYNYLQQRYSCLVKQDKNQTYSKKMKILTELKFEVWNSKLHGSAISYLWNSYYPRIDATYQFNLLEIAAFCFLIFKPDLREIIMPVIAKTCKEFVLIDQKIDLEYNKSNKIGTNLINAKLTVKSLRSQIFWKVAQTV